MYLLKRTFKNIRRNPYISLAVVVIMVVTFLITTVFVIAAVVSQRAINYLEKQPKLLVFFQQEISQEEQILDLEGRLKSTGLVENIDFISKEEANNIYRQLNKDDPLLLELVTPEILPASIEISLKDARSVSQLVELIKDDDRIFDVASPEDVVKNLVSITTKIRIFGSILILLLLLDSILVVLISTAMRVAIRREEIQIMNLVGATGWYIRKPYLLEGAIYGFFGAAIGIVIVYIFIFSFMSTLTSYFVGTKIFPLPWWQFMLIGLGEIVVAVFLGIFGSWLAVFRYLR